MTGDPEIQAMSAVAEALAGLDEDARRRVLAWAAGRYEVEGGWRRSASEALGGVRDESAGTGKDFDDFVDLFDAAGPRTDAERALVGAYWFQVGVGHDDFQSQQVNDALKDVGHGVSNITNALTKLQQRKPALVRQIAKSGRTRQARKRYRVTTAGLAAVHELVAGKPEEER